jgi:hypothetical protein
MDNYGTHGTPEVKTWLSKHRRFVIHGVPGGFQPAGAPANASPAMSPPPARDSRSGWFATPFLWGSCIPDFLPVYPGAFAPSALPLSGEKAGVAAARLAILAA